MSIQDNHGDHDDNHFTYEYDWVLHHDNNCILFELNTHTSYDFYKCIILVGYTFFIKNIKMFISKVLLVDLGNKKYMYIYNLFLLYSKFTRNQEHILE